MKRYMITEDEIEQIIQTIHSGIKDINPYRLLRSLPELPCPEMEGVPRDSAFIDNVCLSYRHDFGLMPSDVAEGLRFVCKEWIRAINNNLPASVEAETYEELIPLNEKLCPECKQQIDVTEGTFRFMFVFMCKACFQEKIKASLKVWKEAHPRGKNEQTKMDT